MKKFISIVFAAMLTLFCVAVPVKADSIFDTAKSIEAGKKYSNKINDTTKSHNYKIQVDGKGTMSITITSDLNYLDFEVFDSDGTKLSPDKKDIKTGSVSFDEQGDANKDMAFIKTVEGGKFKFLTTTTV